MSNPPDRAKHPNRVPKPNFTSVHTEDGQGIDTYPGEDLVSVALAGYGGFAGSHDMGANAFTDPETYKRTPYIDAPAHALQKEHKETGREFPVSGSVVGRLGNKRIADLEDSGSYGGDLVEKNK